MLEEHERRALRRIEDTVARNDPIFAWKLDSLGRSRSRQWRIILVLADVTAVAMVVVGIFADRGWFVLWGTAAIGWLIWLHVARRRTARQTVP